MKKTVKVPKIFVFFLISFLFSLCISFFIGTNSFNHFCQQVILGNYEGLNFPFGLSASGLKGCSLNTLTINPQVLSFCLITSIFTFHVYLISLLHKRTIFSNLFAVLLFSIGCLFAYFLATHLFQQITYRFLEGGIFIRHQAEFPIYFPFDAPLYYKIKWPFDILRDFLLINSGPVIMTVLFRKFTVGQRSKEGIKSFLYVFIGAAFFEFVCFIVVVFISQLFSQRVQTKVLPQIPKKLYNGTIQLPQKNEIAPSKTIMYP